MQEILWLVNSVANDMNSAGSNPKLVADMVMQKLQSINQVASRLHSEFQHETMSVNASNLDNF
jgi:hypothetical protein